MNSRVLANKGKIVYELYADPDVEYRPVRNFPNYAVGSDGTVWTASGGWIRQLKPVYSKKNYASCTLSCGSRKKGCYVHTLVLEAFVGPAPPGMGCRRLDGDPSNNHLDNLKWGTPLEQCEDQRRHGTLPRGSRHPKSKLLERHITEIKKMLSRGMATADVAMYFGVAINTVSRIANNKIWQHVPGEPVPLKDRAIRRGSKHSGAKISEKIAEEMVVRSRAGEQNKLLAKEFGVSEQLVGKIVLGKKWKHATRHLFKSA